MYGLILAGGEGRRLAADGIGTPKSLVAVAGRPQLVWLVEVFRSCGIAPVVCLLRDEVVASGHPALAALGRLGALLVPCRTPSSLHTLAMGLERLPPGAVFGAMVDTVMPRRQWRRAYRLACQALSASAEAAVVVSPPGGEDDRPVRVAVDPEGWVTAVGDDLRQARWVTAGVYALGPSARELARAMVAGGAARVRRFLAALVEGGLPVRAIPVPRAIDLDHARDLAAARAWLGRWRAAASPAQRHRAREGSP